MLINTVVVVAEFCMERCTLQGGRSEKTWREETMRSRRKRGVMRGEVEGESEGVEEEKLGEK